MPCILTALQQDRCLQFPVFSWLLAGPPGNVYRPFQQLKARKIEGLGDSSPAAAAAAAKSLQSCPTLCDPIDSSPPGSPSLGFSRQEHWSGLPFPYPFILQKSRWQGVKLTFSAFEYQGYQTPELQIPGAQRTRTPGEEPEGPSRRPRDLPQLFHQLSV